MEISATVKNSLTGHEVSMRSGTASQSLAVKAKASGKGSQSVGVSFLCSR